MSRPIKCRFCCQEQGHRRSCPNERDSPTAGFWLSPWRYRQAQNAPLGQPPVACPVPMAHNCPAPFPGHVGQCHPTNSQPFPYRIHPQTGPAGNGIPPHMPPTIQRAHDHPVLQNRGNPAFVTCEGQHEAPVLICSMCGSKASHVEGGLVCVNIKCRRCLDPWPTLHGTEKLEAAMRNAAFVYCTRQRCRSAAPLGNATNREVQGNGKGAANDLTEAHGCLTIECHSCHTAYCLVCNRQADKGHTDKALCDRLEKSNKRTGDLSSEDSLNIIELKARFVFDQMAPTLGIGQRPRVFQGFREATVKRLYQRFKETASEYFRSSGIPILIDPDDRPLEPTSAPFAATVTNSRVLTRPLGMPLQYSYGGLDPPNGRYPGWEQWIFQNEVIYVSPHGEHEGPYDLAGSS